MNFRLLTVMVAFSALILFGYILMTRRQEGHEFDQLKAVRPQNVNRLFSAENVDKLKVVQPENATTEDIKENDNRSGKLASKNADDEILRYVAVNNSSR